MRHHALRLLIVPLALIGLGARFMGRTSGAPAPTPDLIAASLVVRCVEKTTGVIAAPAACHADASGTLHSYADRVDPFGDLKYAIDWGDGDTSTFSYGTIALPANKGITPMAAHVFRSAGTFTVTLVVTDAAANTDTVTSDVTIVAEDTAWSDANTRCVCNDGAGVACVTLGVAGYAAPCDNNADGDCLDGGETAANCIESASVDSGLWSAAGKRTAFRKGDTFTMGTVTPASAATDGSLITSYGTGAQPHVTLTTNAASFNGITISGWRSVGIDWDGTGVAGGGADAVPSVFTLSATTTGVSNVMVLDNTIRGMGSLPYVGTQYLYNTTNDRIHIIGNVMTLTDPFPGNWNLGLHAVRYGSIMGNQYNTTAVTGYTGWRGMGNYGLVMMLNQFNHLATGGKTTIQWRSCASAAGGCTRPDKYNIMAYNEIYDTSTEDTCAICAANSHDLGPTVALAIAPKENYIFEGNLYRAGINAGRTTGFQSIFRISGINHVWIRNNIADLRGLPDLTFTTRLARFDSYAGVVTSTPGYTEVRGNTVITSEGAGSRSYQFCDTTSYTLSGDNYCIGNTWWEENTSPTMTPTAGTWTDTTTNYYGEGTGAACPLAGNDDNCTLTAFSSTWNPVEAKIQLVGGARASVLNTAYASPGLDITGWLFRDYAGRLRAGDDDIGAYEEGSGAGW